MNKKLTFLFLMIFLVGLVNAGEAGETLSQIGKVGETYYIPQNCQECTYVTLSRIGNQYGTINMTRNGTDSSSWFYAYMWNESGTYPIEGYFDPNDKAETFNYYIQVTPNGQEVTQGISILYLLSMISIFLIFGVCLFYAINLPFKNYNGEDGIFRVVKSKYIKLILMAVSYGLFTWILAMLIHVSEFIFTTTYSGIFTFLYNTFLFLSYPFLIILIIVGFVNLIKDSKIKSMIDRGLTLDG